MMINDIESLAPPVSEEHSRFIESLHLDEVAKQITVLRELIFNANEQDENNQAILDLIKEEIASAHYQINDQSIASKIMEYHAQCVEEPELA